MYRDDYDERFSNVAHVVRPSTLGPEHYYDTYVGQKCRAYLETYDRNEPWFSWVSFGGPHEPWDTPEPYASMYSGTGDARSHRVRHDRREPYKGQPG